MILGHYSQHFCNVDTNINPRITISRTYAGPYLERVCCIAKVSRSDQSRRAQLAPEAGRLSRDTVTGQLVVISGQI